MFIEDLAEGFAVDVIAGEAGLRDFGQRFLLFIVEHAVVKFEELVGRHVAVHIRADAANIARDAFAATIVVHHDFQKVRAFGDLGEVLFGAIDGAEGIVVPDVPSDAERRSGGFHLGVDGLIGFAEVSVQSISQARSSG